MPEDYGDGDPHGGGTTRRLLYALCAVALLMIIVFVGFMFGRGSADCMVSAPRDMPPAPSVDDMAPRYRFPFPHVVDDSSPAVCGWGGPHHFIYDSTPIEGGLSTWICRSCSVVQTRTDERPPRIVATWFPRRLYRPDLDDPIPGYNRGTGAFRMGVYPMGGGETCPNGVCKCKICMSGLFKCKQMRNLAEGFMAPLAGLFGRKK